MHIHTYMYMHIYLCICIRIYIQVGNYYNGFGLELYRDTFDLIAAGRAASAGAWLLQRIAGLLQCVAVIWRGVTTNTPASLLHFSVSFANQSYKIGLFCKRLTIPQNRTLLLQRLRKLWFQPTSLHILALWGGISMHAP